MHTVHSARIQLLATALNNLALALVVAGLVAPVVSGQLHTVTQLLAMLGWTGSGTTLHFIAQLALGRLRQ